MRKILKRNCRSISSKAKFEILKEFEAKSVDDIKAKWQRWTSFKKRLRELNTGKQSLESELEKTKAERNK